MTQLTKNFEDLAPFSRKSAAEYVVDVILEMLRNGNLAPGDSLPSENDLAKALNVSRPVVREAYRGLQITGIIETRQGGRGVVTDLEPARLSAPFQFLIKLDAAQATELYKARITVEVELVRVGAEKATDADIAELQSQVAAGFDLADDPTAFRALDASFHHALYRLSGNPFLERTAQAYYGVGGEFRRLASEEPGVVKKSAKEHQAIVLAISRRDSDQAAKAMKNHLDSILKSTLTVIRRNGA